MNVGKDLHVSLWMSLPSEVVLINTSTLLMNGILSSLLDRSELESYQLTATLSLLCGFQSVSHGTLIRAGRML